MVSLARERDVVVAQDEDFLEDVYLVDDIEVAVHARLADGIHASTTLAMTTRSNGRKREALVMPRDVVRFIVRSFRK